MENNLDLLQIVRDQISIVFKNEEDILDEKWSKNYKKTINCSNPKGFPRKHIVLQEKKDKEVKKQNPNHHLNDRIY